MIANLPALNCRIFFHTTNIKKTATALYGSRRFSL